MKANAVLRLLSSLAWIDQYNECNQLTAPIIFGKIRFLLISENEFSHEIKRDGRTSFMGFMQCFIEGPMSYEVLCSYLPNSVGFFTSLMKGTSLKNLLLLFITQLLSCIIISVIRLFQNFVSLSFNRHISLVRFWLLLVSEETSNYGAMPQCLVVLIVLVIDRLPKCPMIPGADWPYGH